MLRQTRRAPPRHLIDARVYDHTTTAMHDMSTPPPGTITVLCVGLVNCVSLFVQFVFLVVTSIFISLVLFRSGSSP